MGIRILIQKKTPVITQNDGSLLKFRIGRLLKII